MEEIEWGNAVPSKGPPRSLGDVFSDAVTDAMRVSNQNANYYNLYDAYGEINGRIKSATGKDLSNPLIGEMLAGTEQPQMFDPVADWKRQIGELRDKHPEAMDWDGVEDAPRRMASERMKTMREASDAARMQSGLISRTDVPYLGKVPIVGDVAAFGANLARHPAVTAADFAGGMMGQLYSPVDAMANLMGFGAGKATESILKTALKNAAANAAMQAPLSALKQQDYKQAGLPYGWDVWLAEVEGAAAMGGVLDASIRGGARPVLRRFGRDTPAGTLLSRHTERGGWLTDIPEPLDIPPAPTVRPPISEEVMKRAAENDPAALREVADKMGVGDDPAVKGALDYLETNGTIDAATIAGMKALGIDTGEGLHILQRAVQHGAMQARIPDAVPAAPVPLDVAGARALLAERGDKIETLLGTVDPRIATMVRDGLDAGIPEIIKAVRAADTPEALAKGLGDVDRMADLVALHAMREGPVGLASILRRRPDLIDSNLPLASERMLQARSIAALDPVAFDRATVGDLPPSILSMVSDLVPPPQQGRVLADLAKGRVTDPTAARSALPDLVARESAEMPLDGGATVKEPNDAAAKADTQRLREEHAAEIATAMAPIEARHQVESRIEQAQGEIALLEQKQDAELGQATRAPDAVPEQHNPVRDAVVAGAEALGLDPEAMGMRSEAEPAKAAPSATEALAQKRAELRTEAVAKTDLDAAIDGTPPLDTALRFIVESAAIQRGIDIRRAIDDALRLADRMLPPDSKVTIASTEMRDPVTRALVDATSDPTTGDIALATYALNPAARLGHEGLHTLITRGHVRPEEVALLAKAAREAGVFPPELETKYREAYAGRTNLDGIIAEESAAHLIEAVVAGKVAVPVPTGVMDRIRMMVARVRNALHGYGFRTFDDVVKAVLEGHAARRTAPEARATLADLMQRPRDAATHRALAGDPRPGREPILHLVDDPAGPDGMRQLEQLRTRHADAIARATGEPPKDAAAHPAAKAPKPDQIPEADIEYIVATWEYMHEQQRKAKPQRLSDFLRNHGGIQDQRGEIARLVGSRKSHGALVRKNGMTLDDAAAFAWQRGFFDTAERPTINDFLDVLGDDLAGNRRVRIADEAAMEDHRVAAEMQADLSRLGVDNAKSADEVRAILRSDPDAAAQLAEWRGPQNEGAGRAQGDQAHSAAAFDNIADIPFAVRDQAGLKAELLRRVESGDYSDADLAKLQGIVEGEIASVVDRLPNSVKADVIFTPDGIEGGYDPARRSIFVSLFALNPKAIATHEEIHALRQMFTPREWRLLVERAQKDGIRQLPFLEGKRTIDEVYPEKYGDRFMRGDGSIDAAALESIMNEEAVAYMRQRRVSGQDYGHAINSVFARIEQFLARVRNALRGLGYQTAEDVMSAIDRGDIARRDVHAAMAREDVTAAAVKADGTLFAFAGERAKTADIDALAEAKKMESDGTPREDIWSKTGWFKGVDGKWRFEIDDKYAGVLPPALTTIARKPHSDPITEHVIHYDFFEAYPEAKKLGAQAWPGNAPKSGMKGIHVLGQGIFYNALDNPRSTVLHELQHEAQAQEGFARGSNVLSAGRDHPAIKSIEDSIAKLLKRARDPETPSYDVKAIEKRVAELERERAQLVPYYGQDAYHRSAGEVEARTVQKRMDMTAAERRARPPWLDYDVPEDQQIVRGVERSPQEQQALASVPGAHFPKDTLFAIRTDETTGKRYIEAFHGSPHEFDRFSLDKIGTGEGAQAYGHGLYFADSKGVAESYRDRLSSDFIVTREDARYPRMRAGRRSEGGTTGNAILDGELMDNQGSFDRSVAALQQRRDRLVRLGHGENSPDVREFDRSIELAHELIEGGFVKEDNVSGKMYQVRINADPDHFLDWDKPLSQQSEVVRKAWDYYARSPEAAKKAEQYYSYKPGMTLADIPEFKDPYGSTILRNVPGETEGEAAAYLKDRGIPGIKYLDQGSRGAGDGTRNYVVFDDSLIQITHKDGQPVAPEERASSPNLLYAMRPEQEPEPPPPLHSEMAILDKLSRMTDLLAACR